ncbi:MAG: NADH-quinone oxidoreductase subunit N, partial [SAR324 cluster bacterium]|nr:NADH-quinone oxidoreductase subunit N [SAR324 cluster bacterium]
RIVVVMYMQQPGEDSIREPSPPSVSLYGAIGVTFLGVFYLGIFPSDWIELTLRSVSMLVAGR